MSMRGHIVVVALALSQCHAVCVPPAGPTESPGWHELAAMGCEGNDIGATTGSSVPDDARCDDPSEDGLLAICWDQVNYTNPAMSGQWCTYKQGIPPAACQGGSHPGTAYVCYRPSP